MVTSWRRPTETTNSTAGPTSGPTKLSAARQSGGNRRVRICIGASSSASSPPVFPALLAPRRARTSSTSPAPFLPDFPSFAFARPTAQADELAPSVSPPAIPTKTQYTLYSGRSCAPHATPPPPSFPPPTTLGSAPIAAIYFRCRMPALHELSFGLPTSRLAAG